MNPRLEEQISIFVGFDRGAFRESWLLMINR